MAPRHLLVVLLINLVWGFNFVISKWGVAKFPPVLLTSLRFFLVVLVLSPFLRWRKGIMRDIALVAIFAGAVHFSLMWTGLKLSSAAVAAILVQLQLPFATILSMILLKERLGWRRWLGIALAFGGVMILGFDPHVISYLGGAMMIVVAALSMAFAQILMRRLSGVGVFQLQAWTAAISAPLLLAISFPFEAGSWHTVIDAPWIALAIVAYAGVGASIIGHGGNFYLLQRYDVSLVATMTVLAPVFGALLSVLILGEHAGLRFIIGATVALSGVLIISRRQRVAAAPAAGAEMEIPPTPAPAVSARSAE